MDMTIDLPPFDHTRPRKIHHFEDATSGKGTDCVTSALIPENISRNHQLQCRRHAPPSLHKALVLGIPEGEEAWVKNALVPTKRDHKAAKLTEPGGRSVLLTVEVIDHFDDRIFRYSWNSTCWLARE